jgi:hypothetical protein
MMGDYENMNSTIKRRKDKRENKSLRNTKKKRLSKGGSVIAAGSYGCVFRPSLRCKGDKDAKSTSSYKLVSKLGKKSVIDAEYKMMKKLKSILESIPNYDKYFGLDVSEPCEPAPLNKEDLVHFDDKCKIKDMSKGNINNSDVKSTLSFMDLPYGGVSLLKWIWDGKLKKQSSFLDFIHKSSSLIRYGIVPMNIKGVLHNDIHARNILTKLVKEEEEEEDISHLSLIDWGLATTNSATTLKNITVQRDYPITRIFFVDKIKQPFSRFLQMNLKQNNVKEYSYSKASPKDKKEMYSLLLKMSFELILLSQKDERSKIVHSCRQCDTIFKEILKRNKMYKETYLPFLLKYAVNNKNAYLDGTFIYEVGTTFTTYINTIYLTDMMHKYIEIKDSGIFFNFRKYFTEIYRFNADLYAMSNCILLAASKRFEQDSDAVTLERYSELSELLLNEVFLKSTEKIDFKKVCDALDIM